MGATGRGYQLLSKLASRRGRSRSFSMWSIWRTELVTMQTQSSLPRKLGVSSTSPDACLHKAGLNGPNTCETYKTVKAESGMGDPGWNFKGNFVVVKQEKFKQLVTWEKWKTLLEAFSKLEAITTDFYDMSTQH